MLTAVFTLVLATATATLVISPSAQSGLSGQEDPATQQTEPAATVLEDILVEGRPLAEVTSDFVDRIAAPPSGRGAATWHRAVCIGVGNLAPDAAGYVIDRISTVAENLGLTPGRAGCEPEVFIVFASDAGMAARQLVEARGRRMRIGVPGTDLGPDALEAFQRSDRPVRWWQSSLPVDADTGRPARRLPGQGPFETPLKMTRPSDFGPQAITRSASRLRSPLRDDLSQVIIIVDVARVEGVDIGALSDYLAMIALAQVDPDVDPGSHDTILSLFTPGLTPPPSLTDWDRAYLRGLYDAEQNAGTSRARLGEVSTSMERVVRAQTQAEDRED